jgi:hypothetical protein
MANIVSCHQSIKLRDLFGDGNNRIGQAWSLVHTKGGIKIEKESKQIAVQ